MCVHNRYFDMLFAINLTSRYW